MHQCFQVDQVYLKINLDWAFVGLLFYIDFRRHSASLIYYHMPHFILQFYFSLLLLTNESFKQAHHLLLL